MKRNIGTVERVIRLLISVPLFYAGFFSNPIVSGGLSQKIVAVASFVPFLTAILCFCPLYTLIGFSTYGYGKKTPA